jgi:hypothetical protein
MLTIEEYIACRKQEEKLKDFDLDSRAKNIRKCVNYVFEYFNDYLPQHEQKAKIYMDVDKIEKYRSRLYEFSPEVQKWLIDLYSKHYNLLHFTLKHFIDKNEYFLLSYSEDDFEKIAIECRTKLSHKYPYLRDEKEGILLFIKDYHKIESFIYHDDIIPKLPQSIADWINDTISKYHVELRTFAAEWCFKVMLDKTITKPMVPSTFISYSDFEKEFSNKENIFDIDRLYQDVCTKPFIVDRK